MCVQVRAQVSELETEVEASHAVTLKAREASALIEKMHAAAIKDVMSALSDKRNAVS